jgi:Flp pilus assembly pilin Flp
MFVRIMNWLQRLAQRREERGQATAEYALVILGAVALATLLLTWAQKTHTISNLFDQIIGKIAPG